MPGDYSRYSDQPQKRFSALFMQQGRVQLDADWNESVEILRRRIREEANDIFGPSAVPRQTTPTGFQIAWVGTGATSDISISPGRIYVDGILAECFPDETFSYSKQPYLPNPTALSGLTGNLLVYLDVWEREITGLEDPSIVDPALNGVDTGTRLQTIWQVKTAQVAGGATASCVSDFSKMFPPSGGRLTATTIPATQAPNPCELPAAGGYQGVDNRLYRVEVHDATNLLIKWSRDNASVATSVTTITNSATSSVATVASTGADDDLSFHVGDWVEVIDDAHELNGQAGLMANVTAVNAAQRTLTLDRPLTSGAFNPSSNTVRVRRWDQTQGLSTNSGLVQVTPGVLVALENGIQVKLDIVPGGSLHVGDAWVFAARVLTGKVDPLTSAPPIAVRHHYASLGTFSGLGGSTAPTFTDCRVLWPPIGEGEGCACTVCVDAADHNAGTATIQQAIAQTIKAGGGVVCLGSGTFNLSAALNVSSANALTIRGVGNSTILASIASTAISVTSSTSIRISDLTVTCAPTQAAGAVVAVGLVDCLLVTVERTSLEVTAPGKAFGVGVGMTGVLGDVTIRLNAAAAEFGVLVLDAEDDAGENLALNVAQNSGRLAIVNLRIEENLFLALLGVAVGGQVAVEAVCISGNVIQAAVCGIGFEAAAVSPVQISGNFLAVETTGIEMGCDDFELTDNVIEGAPASAAGTYVGISIVAPPSEGQVRGAIERNRITGFPGGVAVSMSADASRLTVRDNTIDRADGGIIASTTATFDDLVIEGNEITNIGTTNTTTTLPNGFAGIAIVGATRAIVRGNTLKNIGSANTSGVGILGIGVSQPTVVTLTENELRGIGSASITTAQTFGIRVVGPFVDARVVGNRVEVAAPTTTTASTLAFSGISVANPYRSYYPGLTAADMLGASDVLVQSAPAAAPAAAPVAASLTTAVPVSVAAPAPVAAAPPVATITQTAAQPLLFQLNSATSAVAGATAVAARQSLVKFMGDLSLTKTPDLFVIASTNQQSADVSGNVVEVAPSLWALIEVDVVGSCVLRANRVALTSANSSATPAKAPAGTTPVGAVRGYATVLIASDNLVNAYDDINGLALTGTSKATVLGNISTSGISLNGAALNSTWSPLNIST
jgi:hypothetical protein